MLYVFVGELDPENEEYMKEIWKILEGSDIEGASSDESFKDPTWRPTPVLNMPCHKASKKRLVIRPLTNQDV